MDQPSEETRATTETRSAGSIPRDGGSLNNPSRDSIVSDNGGPNGGHDGRPAGPPDGRAAAEDGREQAADSVATEAITVQGARVHNLQDLQLTIPRNQFVVITGPSGSGKSSLAFDTLYAEGQRQYIESLSVYARQFVDQMQRPDVDLIEGLQPTICIDQRAVQLSRRSTVATVTEIYDYLRLMMARIGTPHCYRCGETIRQQSIEQIQERLMAFPEGTKVMIMAPMVRGRKGAHAETFAKIRKAGFLRARVDGAVYDLENIPKLNARKVHHIDAVIDRVIIRSGVRARVGESAQLAVQYGDGLVALCYLTPDMEPPGGGPAEWNNELLSTRYACPDCKINYEELEPRTFSFNSPYGACPVCEGLGALEEFDLDLVIPNDDLSLAEDAIEPWKGLSDRSRAKFVQPVIEFLEANGAGAESALSSLKPKVKHQLVFGNEKKYPGLLILLEKEFTTTTRQKRRAQLERYRGIVPCQACAGSRLRPEATSVRIGEKGIHEITAMSVQQATEFFENIAISPEHADVARPLIQEISNRLKFLAKVGVDYLTLDRAAESLSGGEAQRVRLATSIGSGLVGVCYILDEPSIGLHPRDNQRLIEALRDLQGLGNSVLVVEHDDAMMRQADQLIDMGPTAGADGGRVMAQGTPQEICTHDESITGAFLSGRRSVAMPEKRRRTAKSRSILLEGASINNLQQVDVPISSGRNGVCHRSQWIR